MAGRALDDTECSFLTGCLCSFSVTLKECTQRYPEGVPDRAIYFDLFRIIGVDRAHLVIYHSIRSRKRVSSEREKCTNREGTWMFKLLCLSPMTSNPGN